MTRPAVLLIDLQRDFLGAIGGRMPVDTEGAIGVISAANAVLAGKRLHGALPLLIVNRFAPRDLVGNFFRHRAAIEGTPGAELDSRVYPTAGVTVIPKRRPSAFTNPDLERALSAQQVRELYVLGVFAESCVRATVADACRRGYRVHVLADAVASDAAWKKRLGLWAMRRAGATIENLA
jgi:nicotinamidase-related amidase